jgi:hypothetical protein
MLLECVVFDAFLVSSTVSLALCADEDSKDKVAYISELIVSCKRNPATSFIPWMCVVAFAGMVCVQLRWMDEVAARCLRAEKERTEKKSSVQKETGSESAAFWLWGAVAVAGFFCVVYFDCNGDSRAVLMHRVGVGGLSLGTFAALHLVWLKLRAAAILERVRPDAPKREALVPVPCGTWIEYDVLWISVLAAFIVTGLLQTDYVVSVSSEYAAFIMLFAQLNWLFLVCVERAQGQRVGVVTGSGFSFWQELAVLLTAYGVEAVVVLLAAVLVRK